MPSDRPVSAYWQAAIDILIGRLLLDGLNGLFGRADIVIQPM
jgi:hypothetical protein